MADSDSDNSPLEDEVPLSKLRKKLVANKTATQEEPDIVDMTFDNEDFDDSDNDPNFAPGLCELKKCKEEVFAACHICLKLLCYDHFIEEITSCNEHGKSVPMKTPGQKDTGSLQTSVTTLLSVEDSVHQEHTNSGNETNCELTAQSLNTRTPESFEVEGSAREGLPKKRKRVNKKKEAKQKRQSGQEYISEKTKRVVPARKMKKGCVGNECLRTGRKCSEISEIDREKIFEEFYKLADLHKEREFVARHIETKAPKYSKPTGRRKKSHVYFLTNNGKRLQVCKNTFLATLGIGEKFARVVLTKITDTGIVAEDKRGGRQSQKIIEAENQQREKINQHIDRFPRVESHYCRASSNREYLNSALTLSKMYEMFKAENMDQINQTSFSTYRRVFMAKNLSFHHPKKDQCSLCNSYLKGDEEKKTELRELFKKHTDEKLEVRKLKDKYKKMAIVDPSILAGTFDLQQVMYLPVSKEDALFYKRRLSNFNLTFYNLADHNCDCYIWHEGQSARGSSEISTAVFMSLADYDQKGIKSVYLFSDGCPGQNKNTIMPTMMLYMINRSSNIEEISLRFFESFHGQSEGDSAHSAINSALERAGDIFVPSQLSTIIKMARRKQSYRVHTLEYFDFLNFKKLSEDLKILSIRKDDDNSGLPINWNNVMEMRVTKASPSTIFFKTSHLENQYRSISLKRQHVHLTQSEPEKLNSEPNRLSREKYADLMSLCSGKTPLIRNAEHKSFYSSLPHK